MPFEHVGGVRDTTGGQEAGTHAGKAVRLRIALVWRRSWPVAIAPRSTWARARIILASAEPLSVAEVARQRRGRPPGCLALSAALCRGRRRRLAARGEPQAGQGVLAEATVQRMVALTCVEPPDEAIQWTGRAMANATCVSLRSVQRMWQVHRLQPHRIRTFKRSHDPAFAAKLEDIVGPYMDPPKHATVLSLDEKVADPGA